MSVQDLLQWWNIIYAAPLLVSIVWIVVTALSGAGGGSHSHAAGHADHGLAHGIEHGIHQVGHAVGHSVHHGHAGHDVAHGHTHTADHHHQHAHNDESFMSRVLAILGIGQVPITLIIGIFLLCWGAFGLVANRIFEGIMHYPAVYVWPSMGATFVAASFFTRISAAIIVRVMPSTETFGVSRVELIGNIGHAVYKISNDSGTVNVRDMYGTVHRVQAKTEPNAEPIQTGAEVILVDFDEEDKRFVARISDL